MKKLFSPLIICSTVLIGLQAQAKCLTDATNTVIDDPSQMADCLGETQHLTGEYARHQDVFTVKDLANKLAVGFIITRATLQDYTVDKACPGTGMRYLVYQKMAADPSRVSGDGCIESERFNLELILIHPKTNQVVTVNIPDDYTLNSAPKTN